MSILSILFVLWQILSHISWRHLLSVPPWRGMWEVVMMTQRLIGILVGIKHVVWQHNVIYNPINDLKIKCVVWPWHSSVGKQKGYKIGHTHTYHRTRLILTNGSSKSFNNNGGKPVIADFCLPNIICDFKLNELSSNSRLRPNRSSPLAF